MKSIKINKHLSKVLLLACWTLVLVVFLATITYSWLYQNKQLPPNLVTSNFSLTTDVYFLQSDGVTRVQGSAHKDASTGYYIVDVSNPSATNYGGKLRVDIKYKGVTKSYLRVYVGEMWIVSNKSIFKMDTVFNTPNGLWQDNRLFDNYYYYIGGDASTRGLVYTDTASQQNTYNFITGIQDFAKINTGTLYLEVRAEAVQMNRIQAFWGATQLPS